LDAKANLKDCAVRYGDTALLLACRAGHCDVVSLLLEARASANEAQNWGTSALSIAALGSHHDVCMLLLDASATITVAAFGDAANGGKVEICRTFLEAKADVNAPNRGGFTPTMRAAAANRVSVCALLLAAHANPHAQHERYGSTALHEAARHGARGACALLLQTDAAPLQLLDIKDDVGDNALQIATYRKRAATAQLLRDWRGCAAFDAQTRANWLAPAALPNKGQTYSWAQSRLFDVHLIKEITSFLL
jgi:ankyrin repeat protein